jgi:hypothetical protein
MHPRYGTNLAKHKALNGAARARIAAIGENLLNDAAPKRQSIKPYAFFIGIGTSGGFCHQIQCISPFLPPNLRFFQDFDSFPLPLDGLCGKVFHR